MNEAQTRSHRIHLKISNCTNQIKCNVESECNASPLHSKYTSIAESAGVPTLLLQVHPLPTASWHVADVLAGVGRMVLVGL